MPSIPPPPFLPVTDCWKVTLKGHVSTAHVATVLHVQAPWADLASDVAHDVTSAWMLPGSINSLQTPELVHDTVEVKKVDGVSAPVDLSVTGFSGFPGGATNTPEAVQVAALITWRTGLSGRQHRGRTYVPGIESGHINPFGTQWVAGFITTGQSAANAFIAALATSTHVQHLVVYSRWHNSMSPVETAVFRPYFGTQRRRAESQE